MMTGLKTLNAARGAEAAVKIFAFVARGSGRCRQPLAFDRKKCLVFRVFSAIDPDNRTARRDRKIDRSSAVGVVRFFALELEKIRSEEHTSELQSLMRSSYAVFCLKKKNHEIVNHDTSLKIG